MKTKYSIPVKLQELDELLQLNEEEEMWEQRASSKWSLLNLFSQLLIVGLPLYYLRDLFNIFLSIAFIVPYIITVYYSTTMKYTIFANRIRFQFGLMGKKKVDIPFDDITAINLVTYNDSDLSTIHFGTNKTYKIKKMNFDEGEARPHITFENVKDGEKVNELLMLLWERGRKKK